ncbi:uncharacterized protein BDZ99DRAFT_119468 [Mytilinidion resinicola]|uniref:Uncharacterized protein n=1 Tax=Mytilinidion resinicola TaxID=574789 RepID=A0A6A6Z3F9_9PEZI|nr:uncharacterized protein BDZ99DRAFT_119468 [Mytilinidion resinicola]KAF2815616.1 hypothetical protein BDZ99DRAFT_119468 [Mytilinidion resinicola]
MSHQNQPPTSYLSPSPQSHGSSPGYAPQHAAVTRSHPQLAGPSFHVDTASTLLSPHGSVAKVPPGCQSVVVVAFISSNLIHLPVGTPAAWKYDAEVQRGGCALSHSWERRFSIRALVCHHHPPSRLINVAIYFRS